MIYLKEEIRKQRSVRATDEEWEIFKRLSKMIKRGGIDRVEEALSSLGDLRPKEQIEEDADSSELDNVYTISEASDLWEIPHMTLKSACAGQRGCAPRFKPWEMRKSGRVYLVTKAGMERLYGKKLK
nr:MAG TPA: hypothetical protein [Caudoviricetes sp.]